MIVSQPHDAKRAGHWPRPLRSRLSRSLEVERDIPVLRLAGRHVERLFARQAGLLTQADGQPDRVVIGLQPGQQLFRGAGAPCGDGRFNYFVPQSELDWP